MFAVLFAEQRWVGANAGQNAGAGGLIAGVESARTQNIEEAGILRSSPPPRSYFFNKHEPFGTPE